MSDTAQTGGGVTLAMPPQALYQAHFGLHRAPFTIVPDPRSLYLSTQHREALAHLRWALDSGGGLVLLTGEIGAGKTTVSRCFIEDLPSHCDVAWILNPLQSPQELLQSLLQDLGETVAPDSLPAGDSLKPWVDRLNATLLSRHAQGRQCMLLIDEAQHLSAEVLEQLRLLTNLETHDRKLLQIVLVGQPELRDLINRPGLEQLRQRVVARFHLSALSASDIGPYIGRRLAAAGGSGELPFKTEALAAIHRDTGGIPRWINLLCDRLLLAAYARGQARVDAAMVGPAWAEIQGQEVQGRPVPVAARAAPPSFQSQHSMETAHPPTSPSPSLAGWILATVGLGLLLFWRLPGEPSLGQQMLAWCWKRWSGSGA